MAGGSTALWMGVAVTKSFSAKALKTASGTNRSAQLDIFWRYLREENIGLLSI